MIKGECKHIIHITHVNLKRYQYDRVNLQSEYVFLKYLSLKPWFHFLKESIIWTKYLQQQAV